MRRVNERGIQRAGFHMEASASINCYGANHRTSPAITPRRAFATIVNTADSPEAVAQLLARLVHLGLAGEAQVLQVGVRLALGHGAP